MISIVSRVLQWRGHVLRLGPDVQRHALNALDIVNNEHGTIDKRMSLRLS